MNIVCEVCGRIGYLQRLTKNYSRVRHYAGLDSITEKPMFEYHRQSLEYINSILASKQTDQSIDLIGQNNIDLNLNNSGSDLENNVRGCPSLVGGRPAKPVVSNGRVGSNPTPRAILFVQRSAIILACS